MMEMELVVIFNFKKAKENALYPDNTKEGLNDAVQEVNFYDEEPLPDTTILAETQRQDFKLVREQIIKSLREIASDNDHYLSEVGIFSVADGYFGEFTENEDGHQRAVESVVEQHLARKFFGDDEFKKRIMRLAGYQPD